MSVLSNRFTSKVAPVDAESSVVLDEAIADDAAEESGKSRLGSLGFDGWTKVGGAGLAGTGLLHFIAPKLFVPLTRAAFPEQTERFVTVNGTLETLLGTALLAKRTRTFGFLGLLVYLVYLGINVKTTREQAAAEAAQPNVVPSVRPVEAARGGANSR